MYNMSRVNHNGYFDSMTEDDLYELKKELNAQRIKDYQNGEYEKAKEYLNKTTISESWSDFAKNEYKLGNKEKANEYAEKGLKEYASTTEPSDIYEVITEWNAIDLISKETMSHGVYEIYKQFY